MYDSIRLLHEKFRVARVADSALAAKDTPGFIICAPTASMDEGDATQVQHVLGTRARQAASFRLTSEWGIKAFQTLDAAASVGHLHIVRWLIHIRHVNSTARALDQAATNGHVGVVLWLHENGSYTTIDVMDSAAENYHFELVKQLHESREEGFTEAAMDSAARNGHFLVMQYLHQFRNEGCSINASICAAASGNREIIKWLKHFYPSRIRLVAIAQAAPIFRWSKHDVDLCDL